MQFRDTQPVFNLTSDALFDSCLWLSHKPSQSLEFNRSVTSYSWYTVLVQIYMKIPYTPEGLIEIQSGFITSFGIFVYIYIIAYFC